MLHCYVAGLRTLMSLSKQLRAKRFEAGALSLASPEVKFKIDTETHNPLDVGMYQVRAGCYSCKKLQQGQAVYAVTYMLIQHEWLDCVCTSQYTAGVSAGSFRMSVRNRSQCAHVPALAAVRRGVSAVLELCKSGDSTAPCSSIA
jgi:hypothetical protein